jgi:putative peptidoglycan lipid II flippase
VPLITTLFHHGAFTANDVLMTRSALLAYSIGLLGLILVKVLAPGFYARQNVRTPVRIAILTLHHAALEPGTGRLAATRRSGAVHRPGGDSERQPAFSRPAAAARSMFRNRAGCCSTLAWHWPCSAMGAALWFTVGEESAWLELEPQRAFAGSLSLLVAFGASVYFATLWIAGFRLRDFKRSAAE